MISLYYNELKDEKMTKPLANFCHCHGYNNLISVHRPQALYDMNFVSLLYEFLLGSLTNKDEKILVIALQKLIAKPLLSTIAYIIIINITIGGNR